ncbi:hypothetical protein FRX31_010513 [Thalictrum thalictroides]|uniref:S-protein homolog n=1 Tax=Thalictrum thalictroides TaxID=46969 RepID=A0A7J6WR92_THATH|nr:hypothetical protein FRX31_010513 [Thalictrum thalictroides]
MTNNIGKPIWYHCKTYEDDFPAAMLQPDEEQNWKFYNMETVVFCEMGNQMPLWRDNVELFNDGLWGYHMEWSLRMKGIYRWESSLWGSISGNNKWIRQYEWIY